MSVVGYRQFQNPRCLILRNPKYTLPRENALNTYFVAEISTTVFAKRLLRGKNKTKRNLPISATKEKNQRLRFENERTQNFSTLP
jgi:hypothetical protein